MIMTMMPPRPSCRPAWNWPSMASKWICRSRKTGGQWLNRWARALSKVRFGMKCLCWILGGTLLPIALRVWAANPGDEVVVVYNSRVPESRKLAEYYALKRQVPTNQICGFELSTTEEM